MLKFSSILMATLVVAGFSFAASADDCFSARRVRSFHVVNSRELVVEVRRNETYNVKVAVCPELRWADAIAFDTFGGFDRVCRGDDLLIIDQFYPRRILDRCWIQSIDRIEE